MKKIIKSALIFCLIPMLSNGFTQVYAEAHTHECNTIEILDLSLRAQLCVCGNGEFRTVSTNDSGWSHAGQTAYCMHGKRGNDERQTRTITYFTACTSCGRTGPTSSNTEERIICKGW